MYVNEQDSLVAKNLNVFLNYVLSFNSAAAVDKWRNNCNMNFYQNQLNFAVWCASFGCEVSIKHLNTSQNLLSSVYKFHIYIIKFEEFYNKCLVLIPGESLFNTADNHINLIAYKKICNKFGVHANADFRFKGGNNGGLGTMYNYVTRTCYVPLTGIPCNPSRFQFIPQTTSTVIKIDYISQSEAVDGWMQFY